MDYEREYKSLVAKISTAHLYAQTDSTKNVLEDILPELRESEDEKVRKEIIDFIQWAEDRGMTRHDYHQAKRPAVWLAYLEKQKENIEKEYIFRPLAGTVITTAAEQAIRRAKEGEHLVLAFNGAYIPVREYNSAKELIDEYDTYRKKQKKQKTDAKSERVIKAARRVLNDWLDGTDCPDVSGDFTELEYAIREYDGEEKQKEQKPNIELIQRSWYMEGYHDREFGKEPKWVIKTGDGGPKYEENPKYGQMLEAEQKTAEWSEEDKRKLNRIYEILGYAADDKGFLTSKRIIGDKEAIELQDFLKSLRPSWKPSEEQMSMLAMFANLRCASRQEAATLESLYNALKKLI